MRFWRKIYDVDYSRLNVLLTPVLLRKPVFGALLESLVYAVRYVYLQFWQLKLWAEEELTITSQVVYMERKLNDLYDYADRRIYIEDGYSYDGIPLYTVPENIPQPLYTTAENTQNQTLWTYQEAATLGKDFNVVIPAGIVYDYAEVAAMVRKYKLPSKTFTINSI